MRYKPQEWVVFAAAHTQLALRLRGHESGEAFIAWACQILGRPLPADPAQERQLHEQLTNAMRELQEELQ